MNENNKQNYFKENRMDKQEKFDSEIKAFDKKFKKMFNYENFLKNYPIEWNDIFNGKITEVKKEKR